MTTDGCGSMENNRDRRESALTDAVLMELEGKDLFEKASKMMRHPRAMDLFKGLAKQEEIHAEVLVEQLTGLRRGTQERTLDEMRDHPRHFDFESVFGHLNAGSIELDPGVGELDVLRLGIEVEKKSIDYYESARRVSEDAETKATFEWLANEEKGHLVILRAEYDNRVGSGFYYDSPEFSLEV